ncbi:hypothetical protein [Bullifex porci]|uniref:hypothetical protein n=1 Tax=Bullifex porci TaxID=2606638 RepID=UPI0023F2D1E4|nr:hypothetical protein [Bullifex porci]
MVCSNLYATDYNEIIQKAKSESKSVQNAELSYLNSKLTLEKSELEDELQITVSGNAQVSPDLTVAPTVKIVLPNDGSTTITATVPSSLNYDDTKIYSFSPKVTVDHNFDLSGFDEDVLTALSNSRTALNNEYTYQYALLSFENTCISTIKTIVNLEKNIENQSYLIEKSEKSIKEKLALGQITTSSITYKQLINQLELSKNTLKAYEKQYEIAKSQYKEATNLDWDGLSNLPSPDLTLSLLPTGNTKVIVATIDEEIAKENINSKNAALNPQNVKVSGGVESANLKNSLGEKNSLTATAGATYSQGNWSVGASLSSSYDFKKNSFDTPSVKVSGSWSNKTTKRSDEIELQKLQNSLVSASNSASEEYTSYLQSYNALQLEVLQYEFNVTQTKANTEYLKANLENVKALYDAGLATKQELEDAEFNVKLDEYTQTVLVLDGLTLSNKIKMLNL